MIAANIFQFMVGSFPLLLIVTLINSHNPLNILLIILPFAALVLVATGVGLFLSALFVFFRDIGYFYEITTFILWITSPVFYPVDIVPARIQPFVHLNPLVPIIVSIRQISLEGSFPEPIYLIRAFLSGIIILTLGWVFFRRVRPAFMDLL